METNNYMLFGDGSSVTIFEAATKNDCKFLLKNTLQRKFLDITDSNRESALHKAARYNSFEFASYCIKIGATIDLTNSDGETPLFIACRHRHEKMVDLLLFSGANPNKKNNFNVSPIQIASSRGNVHIVQKLYSYGGAVLTPDNIGMKAIHYATKSGNVEMIKTLLQLGSSLFDTDTRGNTLLHYAAIKGNDEMISYLLRNTYIGDIKNIYGNTAFHEAVKVASVETIKCFLDYGFNPLLKNNDEKSAFEIALETNYEISDAIEKYLDSSQYKKILKKYPLHYAAINKDSSYIQNHIDSENANELDNYGRSILYYIIINDDVDSFNILKRYMVNYDRIDSYQSTAVMVAILSNAKNVLKPLLKEVNDINYVVNNKNYLYYAIIKNNYEIVKLLIDLGININYIDDKGKTLYTYALEYGNNKIVSLLLENDN